MEPIVRQRLDILLVLRPRRSVSSRRRWLVVSALHGYVHLRARSFLNRRWWALIPGGVALLLELRVESAAGLAIQTVSALLPSQYAATASEFLLFMLLWVVFLPGVSRPGYISSSLWRNSQAVLLLVDCVIASFQAHTGPLLERRLIRCGIPHYKSGSLAFDVTRSHQ